MVGNALIFVIGLILFVGSIGFGLYAARQSNTGRPPRWLQYAFAGEAAALGMVTALAIGGAILIQGLARMW